MNTQNYSTTLEGGTMHLDSMIKFLKLNWLAMTCACLYSNGVLASQLSFKIGRAHV